VTMRSPAAERNLFESFSTVSGISETPLPTGALYGWRDGKLLNRPGLYLRKSTCLDSIQCAT
jgi:hypothetical protein